jgi:OOP family OmpA-OmpF porin
MIKNNRLILTSMLAISSLLFLACSSDIKKAYIPNSADPREEIQKSDRDLNSASFDNIDVLAPKEFKSSEQWLAEAKTDLNDKQNQNEILDDLRKGRGSLEKAYQMSKNRADKAPGLYEARQAATNAGARKYSELKETRQDLDADVSAIASDIGKVSADKISDFQERYIDLEKRAVILSQLSSAQAQFNGAKNDNAAKYAPRTFKKADLALKNAESVIATNVRNPAGYNAAVATAVSSSNLLNDVMKIIKQNDKKISETAALKIASQNSKINTLSTELDNTQMESEALSAKLDDKNSDLKNAQVSIAAQNAMESARTQFSPDEAEAYQQGENLLIRLKKMNFASGRSDLPGKSLLVLAKVSSVATAMNASTIKIEGHTDSVGTDSKNRELSEKRAKSVATYFLSNGFNEVTSEGFGFQKPIATNKSKAGRAQNRRVDIIITPNKAAITQ